MLSPGLSTRVLKLPVGNRRHGFRTCWGGEELVTQQSVASRLFNLLLHRHLAPASSSSSLFFLGFLFLWLYPHGSLFGVCSFRPLSITVCQVVWYFVLFCPLSQTSTLVVNVGCFCSTRTFLRLPPAPSSLPSTMAEYYVYYCQANFETPFAHWKFIPTSTSQQLLPDIREARPAYLYSDVTKQYTALTRFAIGN